MSYVNRDFPAVMNHTLAKLNPPRLCDEVAEQIEAKILKGDFQQGDKLPSEGELAEQAGISRRAIRDALKILETKGLVEVRKGSGTYVVRNDYEFYLASLTDNVRSYLSNARASLVDIFQFRILIEGSGVEQLARKQDTSALEPLEENLKQQRAALKSQSVDQYNLLHHRFHAGLVDSLRNPIVSMLYEQVTSLIRDRMLLKSRDLSIMKNAVKEHEEIIGRIKLGDPSVARIALEGHFKNALENLSSTE